MPELPDVLVYVDWLQRVAMGRRLKAVRVVSPFVLRTFDPPIDVIEGSTIRVIGRLGKQFVFEFDSGVCVIVHLMIAGRWRWSTNAGEKTPAKIGLASMLFDHGTLHLVESSPKKRASIHVVESSSALSRFRRGGLDLLACSTGEFARQLRSENHTLKRSLTDPRLFDGIGNAYSDEILHAARLSPVMLSSRISDAQVEQLHEAARRTLAAWTRRLGDEFAGKFPGPGEITAFRPDFAVHGKFGQPCPACGTSVQRIVFAENECNYCPRCQTEGKLLADRSLSRLLKSDWPKTIEEWEQSRG